MPNLRANKWGWRLLTLVGLGLAFAVILHTVRFEQAAFWAALQAVRLTDLLLGLGIVLVQISFQISRLWVLCPQAVGMSWLHAARAFVSGQFVSTFIQGQAGHAIKIATLRKPADRQGRSLPMATSTAVILLDKITDVTMLLLLTGGAVLYLSIDVMAHAQRRLNHPGLWQGAGLGLLLAIIVCISVDQWQRRSQRAGQWLQEFQRGMRVVKSPVQVGQGVGMAFGDWCSEMVLLYLLCWAQGFTLSPAQLIISLFVLNVGISIPVAVANLGTFEASLTFALTQMGVPLVQGVAIATLFHILQMLGIATWLLFQFRSRIKT